MINKSDLIKALDDKCILYDTNHQGYIRVKSNYSDIWWHIHYASDHVGSVHNGNTGRLVSEVYDMDSVFIKNNLLVFEKTDRSSAVGIPL